MASKRTFSSKQMLEDLDKPTQPVVPSETSPVDVLTDDTPYDDRSAAALLAQLQQLQTPAPVAATTPVAPEVSTPQTLEELLAAQGPPTTAPAPVNTGLPPGVTQADLDAIAAQFRQAGTPETPAMNFTGDPNQPFFDMRLPDGRVNPVYFDPNLDKAAVPNMGPRANERDGEPGRQCPPNMEFDYELGRCVRIGGEDEKPPITPPPPPPPPPPAPPPPPPAPPPPPPAPPPPPPPVTPPPTDCPPGLVRDPSSGLCVPAAPATPACPEGSVFSTVTGKCEPITIAPPPPPPPPPPQPPVTPPVTPPDCGPGYVRSTVTGKCEPITIAPPVTPPVTPPTPPPPPPPPPPSPPVTPPVTPPTPPPPVQPPPGKVTPFDPSAALLEAYNRLFGKAPAVNLGGYKGMPTGGPAIGSTPVTVPTPNAPSVSISTPTATGVRSIDFTPGKPQFFGNVPGSMLPGTLPSNYNPIGNYKGPLPTDLLAQNPNLSPSILGGVQGLGYYTDRLGNRIFSPGGGLMRFAEGGEVSEEDADSARAQLQKLLENAPAQTQTEVSVSPNARSVRKTSRKAVESGLGKGISMKMEEAKVSSEPSSREQLAAMSEQYKDLLRNTLTKPTLTARGPLTARRFAEGGPADKEPSFMDKLFGAAPLQVKTYAESVRDPAKLRAPLTEKSMSAQELDKLRELIGIAESNPALSEKTGKPLPGVVDYAHHREQIRRRNPDTGLPLALLDSDFNPGESANLRNTLGQFVFERLPDGTLVVKDRYDYTGDVGERTNPLVKYANKKGVDRPVNIRIPPKKK